MLHVKYVVFNVHLKKKNVLDKELIKNYISQAKEIGTFRTIGFSGGEAILYYEQLKEIMEYAFSLGFRSTLVTNGFWGRDVNRGYQMISGLVEAGLSKLSISVDRFHQEFIPIDSVKSALRITEKIGVKTTITFMGLKGDENCYELMEQLRPEIYGKNLYFYPVFPVGRATEYVLNEQIIKICHKDTAACPYTKDFDIIVLFDGTIMMCCSEFSKEIEMTHLGNYQYTSLKEAINTFNQNDFIYVLLINKFKWYIDLAEKLGFKLEEYYSIPCQLCYTLFTNKEYVQTIKPYVKEEADQIRLSKLLSF